MTSASAISNRYKMVRYVLAIILVLNWVVAAAKIIVGYMIDSHAMMADGFHSIADGSSNVIGLIGIYFASQPADADHPYGHKKIETLVGLVIAGMLGFIGLKVIVGGFGKFSDPQAVNVNIQSLVVMVVTIAINVWVTTYEARRGRELQSDILVADAMHTRSDVFVSLSVLVTLIGLKLGLPLQIDAIASIIVGGFILNAGYEVVAHTLKVLTDSCVIDERLVREAVMDFDEVRSSHAIRSRGREDDIHIDLHVHVDPQMTVQVAHHLSHRIGDHINEKLHIEAQTIVHVEPATDEEMAKEKVEPPAPPSP